MATIMVIEDDAELQTMLKLVLERHGFTVQQSPNGVDALYQVNYYKPDLIILDLMMPLASGDAVLGYIRSTREIRSTKVLVMSAHPNAQRLSQQLDADAFLAKPVEMLTLVTKVRELLGEKA